MKKIFLVFGFLFYFHTILFAQLTFNVQGVLRDQNGQSVPDGNYEMTFRIYSSKSGGSAVWTETQSSVPVAAGVYNVMLGSVNPLDNLSFDSLISIPAV